MTTLEQIEAAIAKLSKEDLERLSAWIVQRYQTDWDREIEEDSESGALDFLIREISDEPVNLHCFDGDVRSMYGKDPDSITGRAV